MTGNTGSAGGRLIRPGQSASTSDDRALLRQAGFRRAAGNNPRQRGTDHQPDARVRHCYYLETDCGDGAILAERRLSPTRAPNFRDLGGYVTADGRKLKWGNCFAPANCPP